MKFVNKIFIFFILLYTSVYSFDNIELYNKAVAFYNEQDYYSAIKYFESAYNSKPESELYVTSLLSAYNSYALKLIREDNYFEALSFLKEAYELNSEDDAVKNNLSVLYSKLGNESFNKQNYNNAIKYYIQALNYSDEVILRNNISIAYQNMAVFEENNFNKIILLNRSIEYNKKNYAAYFNLGILYYQQKNYDKSIKKFKNVYKNSIELKASSALYLGLVYENMFAFNEAVDYFTKAVEIGLSDAEEFDIARQHLLFLEKREYNYEKIFYINNKSDFDIYDVTIKIVVPDTINNIQNVKLKNEIVTFDYIKKFFKDNNSFHIYYSDSIPAASTNKIILSFDISVLPPTNDIEFLKVRKNSKNMKPELFNYISTGYKNDYDLLNEIYNFVISSISYEITDKDYSIEEILKYNKGKCVEYTLLFNYLAELAGYKTRKVVGEVYEIDPSQYILNAGHTWSEIYIPEIGWYSFDPTFEDTGKRNYFGNVRTDRFIVSYENLSGIEIDYKVKYNSASLPPDIALEIISEKKIDLLTDLTH